MDSPVIVDTGSKFGRGIDLDRSFPGFPFDDDGFGRRSDIRSHLDDLASRHPEFADQLLGPPWGDIPFHGSTRNRRRGSGSGGSGYQSYPDEDARSQTSGSSAASAASGASGVSSHGDPEVGQNPYQSRPARQEQPYFYQQDTRRNPIPQYGLRNTVDIGQQRHDMENVDKGNRGQRSMSAPPENRQQQPVYQHQQQQPGYQQQPQQEQQQQPQQGQRFVSRVDITPQHNQPNQQGQQMPFKQQQQPQAQAQPQSQPQPQPQPQPQQQQQQQQKPQQSSNVRHIPIFVEGRDEPVLPKKFEDSHFQRQSSPPQFQKPSNYNQHFGGRQWMPHFQDSFYQPSRTFEHSPTRRGQQQQPQGFQQPSWQERQRPDQQQQYEQYQKQPPKPQQQQQQPDHTHQQAQQPQQPQQQEPPKPSKPPLPKDPLERVALVQKEVDSLAEQVKLYNGNSRKDKDYMYLDEMLTRELIKLDDIETEGRDNVRQARRNAIKTIQQTISMLESKAPVPGQQNQNVEGTIANDDANQEVCKQEPMDIDQKQQEQQNSSQQSEPIPLPPAPSSPTKTSSEMNEEIQTEEQKNTVTDQTPAPEQSTPQEGEPVNQTYSETMETGSSKASTVPMELQQQQNAESQNKETEAKKHTGSEEKSNQSVQENDKATGEQEEKVNEKMEVEKQPGNVAPKAPKKVKKSKKQAPVSDKPIPLPAPQATTEAGAK